MTLPTPYQPATDFSAFSTSYPAVPHSGSGLDAEFDAIRVTLSEVITNLGYVVRDDGRLRNLVVTPDTLASSTLALITAAGGNVEPRGAHADGTVYAVADLVKKTGVLYFCLANHTAGTSNFASELAAGYWGAMSGGAASDIAFTPAGNTSSTTVQAAIEEVQTDLDTHKAGNLTVHGATALGQTLATAANVTAAQQALDLEVGVDVPAYDADIVKRDETTNWTGLGRGAVTNLTITNGTATIDFGLGAPNLTNVVQLTLTSNVTLSASNVSNITVPIPMAFIIKQNATGNYAVTFGSDFKFAAGSDWNVTAAANVTHLGAGIATASGVLMGALNSNLT